MRIHGGPSGSPFPTWSFCKNMPYFPLIVRKSAKIFSPAAGLSLL